MTTMLDAARGTDVRDGAAAVRYRVRLLSLRGEVSETGFATEVEARAHQQGLIGLGGGGLAIVERLVRIDGDGGPGHYEVTAIARDLC